MILLYWDAVAVVGLPVLISFNDDLDIAKRDCSDVIWMLKSYNIILVVSKILRFDFAPCNLDWFPLLYFLEVYLFEYDREPVYL